MKTLNKIWQAWKRLGQLMGTVLAYIVLTLFYFTLFVPYGLAMTWLSDPLRIRQPRPVWAARDRRTDRRTDRQAASRRSRPRGGSSRCTSWAYLATITTRPPPCLQDGVLVAAADEERFTRVKHDNSYPQRAIDFCLRQAGIQSGDLDYVVFYEKPLLKFERILITTLGTFPRSYPVFREAMVAWFNEKLWVKSKLQTTLGIPPERILFVEHHLSHAASALFTSPFDEAAILTVDGVGEWTTATVGKGTALWAEADRGRVVGGARGRPTRARREPDRAV